MREIGARPPGTIMLGRTDTQLGRGENHRHTAPRASGRYVDIINFDAHHRRGESSSKIGK